MVLTPPERAAGRGLQLVSSPVKQLSLERGLGLFQPASLKLPEVEDRLRAAAPELLVVAAYGLLVPPSLLELPRYGAVNVHASLLPRWRGAAPIQRALLAGDTRTGVSIMKMDAGLDTGPVYRQRQIDISVDDDAGSLHDKLASLGGDALADVLVQLGEARAQVVAQPQEGITYARKIDKAETVLDWSRPAEELERAVRAFRPSPGASTSLDGQPLKIWRAQRVDRDGEPGTLLDAYPALTVACGKGALRILELQRSGGRRVGATEFLRGRRLAPGTRLK